VIAAALALAGALLIGAGLARQHAAASAAEGRGGVDPRLLLQLGRQRSWLAGVAFVNGGFVLVASGIASGRLAVVEPVAATQVLWALVFAARAKGRRLGRDELLACAATIAGLVGFLLVASPSERPDAEAVVPWAVPIATLGIVAAAGVVGSRRLAPASRGIVLAALAGLTFGTADALIKAMSDVARADGAAHLVAHWSLYVWMACGLLAVVLQQSSYQATHLAAAMPATSTLAPTTATLLGAAMLGEQVRGGWAVPFELALFGLLLVGVARLAASPALSGDELPPAVAPASG
jgi:hypothetical protein